MQKHEFALVLRVRYPVVAWPQFIYEFPFVDESDVVGANSRQGTSLILEQHDESGNGRRFCLSAQAIEILSDRLMTPWSL